VRLSRAIVVVRDYPNPSLNPGLNPPGASSPSTPGTPVNLPSNLDSYQVAEELSARLEAAGCDFALGGAIALDFWLSPAILSMWM
jgi:hypothetical protein